jgi:transcriptional regulator with XRE-family HTH domain
MGIIVRFTRAHARASSSKGYKSGRNSCRETPETLSTAKTRSGGTSSHCETACAVTPIRRANLACPPTLRTARDKACDLSFMGTNSSMALPESQALLHCPDKAVLYIIDMTLGKRIKAARERLQPKPTQTHIGELFGISDKAVSSWERDETVPELDKIAKLAKRLQVPCIWLLEGRGEPPSPDALEVVIEDLKPSERAVINATIQALRKERGNVA